VILGLDEAARFLATGVPDAAKVSAVLASRARQAFDPPIQLSVDTELFEGVDLAVARVHGTPTSANHAPSVWASRVSSSAISRRSASFLER
jgi:hypothetical protein